jgi:cephalosporin hydroxylase
MAPLLLVEPCPRCAPLPPIVPAVKAIRTSLRTWFDQTILRRAGLAAFDQHTANVTAVRWLGFKVRQNPLDAWTIQELVAERDVDLVLECGTYHWGLTLFVASLFDLLDRGRVITIDVEDWMTATHPRIERILGSSVDPRVVAQVSSRIAELGPGNCW